MVSENKHWWDETRERKGKLCQATLLHYHHFSYGSPHHKVSFAPTTGTFCLHLRLTKGKKQFHVSHRERKTEREGGGDHG